MHGQPSACRKFCRQLSYRIVTVVITETTSNESGTGTFVKLLNKLWMTHVLWLWLRYKKLIQWIILEYFQGHCCFRPPKQSRNPLCYTIVPCIRSPLFVCKTTFDTPCMLMEKSLFQEYKEMIQCQTVIEFEWVYHHMERISRGNVFFFQSAPTKSPELSTSTYTASWQNVYRHPYWNLSVWCSVYIVSHS